MLKKIIFPISFCLLLSGCTAGSVVDSFKSTTTNNLKNIMTITSPAFKNGGPLAQAYSCDGAGTNPPLIFSDVPFAAKSLVLIADDPDAPRGTFTHWVIYNIDPKVREIPTEGVPRTATVGNNDFGQAEYGPVCPPSGTHRYFFRLYALDTDLNLPAGSGRAKVEAAMKGHIIAQSEIYATYKK